jgi:hypothetical protein
VSRQQIVAVLGMVLGGVVLAYFWLLAAKPEPLARILLRQRYQDTGWTEQRMVARVRLLGIVGIVSALAVILLAIFKFIG